MHRLLILISAMFSISALAQGPTPTLPGPLAENLPDAPRSQMASLFTGSTQIILRASINDLRPISAVPSSLEGARITLSILSPLTSKLPSGSPFQARLDKPLEQEGRVVLPQGTKFEGHVQTQPARRVMRPGTMYIAFDRMILPDGGVRSVRLHLVDAAPAAIKTDAEGRLHPTISKKRLAIQLGGTALTAKFVDDLAELAGGAAVGAGTARIVGGGAAATFFLLQKGREVKLNSGDKIQVEFDRAVLSPANLLHPIH